MKNKLTAFSQKLRKDMTKEEKHLWYDFLKDLSVTVNRQKVIGNYIADFYISSARIIIELDGSQHYTEKGEKDDVKRDDYFRSIGIKVLRFTNRQIHENFSGVCTEILNAVDKRS